MSGIFLMLAGSGGAEQVIEAFDGSLVALDISAPLNASATVTLNTDGSIGTSASPSESSNTIGANWHKSPAVGVGTGIWVRATVTSGTTPTSGSGVGTWLELSSARSWGNASDGSPASVTSTLLLEFSNNASGTVSVGSASIVVTATAFT